MERRGGTVLSGVGDPELGGDEQLVARDAAGGDGTADGCLVLVGGGGVDVPVAGSEGVGDGLLGLLGRHLVDAEAEDGHLNAVVKREGGDLGGHVAFLFRRGAERPPGRGGWDVLRNGNGLLKASGATSSSGLRRGPAAENRFRAATPFVQRLDSNVREL